jgi:FdhD protein
VKRNPAISERRVIRAGDGGEVLDRLAVEGPLEVRVRGEPAVVLMRTPGDDEELVTGFLIGEGFAASSTAIGRMKRARGGAPALAGDVLDLPEAELARDVRAGRSLYSSAACGACGKTELGELARGASPIRSALEVPAAVIAGLPERLRAEQAAFDETGGLHAAGAFDAAGALLAAREDVGRHNAVDKLVGWAARREALPLSDAILCVSGRLSFEIVQKAIAAGFPVIAAVSAPSSLAVDLAERYRVTLCGFVRGGRFNIYAHPRRIT